MMWNQSKAVASDLLFLVIKVDGRLLHIKWSSRGEAWPETEHLKLPRSNDFRGRKNFMNKGLSTNLF
jgi:hypothetical protein